MESISCDLVSGTGKKLGSVELDAQVFAARIAPDLLHAVVRWQRADRRAGTHSTLNRDTMLGGGKKPWRQKGTGRARAGSSNSPVWVGGAVSHGPKPRKYGFKLPKRVRAQALASALSEKFKRGTLIVVDEFPSSGKTQDFAKFLNACGVGASKVSVVVENPEGKNTSEAAQKIFRASRNISNVVAALTVAGVNVYDLVRSRYLVCSRQAIEGLRIRLSGVLSGKAAEAAVSEGSDAPKRVRKTATKKASAKVGTAKKVRAKKG